MKEIKLRVKTKKALRRIIDELVAVDPEVFKGLEYVEFIDNINEKIKGLVVGEVMVHFNNIEEVKE